MLPGFNHNLRHRGALFHVQSEDGGQRDPKVVTQLFFDGRLLAIDKWSYAALVRGEGVKTAEAQVKAHMQAQHKAMLRRVAGGEFDGVLARERTPSKIEAARAAAQSDSPTLSNTDFMEAPTVSGPPPSSDATGPKFESPPAAPTVVGPPPTELPPRSSSSNPPPPIRRRMPSRVPSAPTSRNRRAPTSRPRSSPQAEPIKPEGAPSSNARAQPPRTRGSASASPPPREATPSLSHDELLAEIDAELRRQEADAPAAPAPNVPRRRRIRSADTLRDGDGLRVKWGDAAGEPKVEAADDASLEDVILDYLSGE